MIANVAIKEYLIYFLNIILVICFLLGHCSFASYIAYVLVQHYSINNPKNSEIVDKDKKIYWKMHIADWW